MDKCNYFIKMLMLSINGKDTLMLYGFCVPTAQKPYSWRQQRIKKSNQRIWSAILLKEHFEPFLNSLTQSETVSAGNLSFASPELVKRPLSLSNDGRIKSSGPVLEYRPIIELWNTHKRETIGKILESFGNKEKERHKKMHALLAWARQECGIDFCNDGSRFGNFEFYQALPYADSFDIEQVKECGLLKTTVKKRHLFLRTAIVNCVAECRGRSIVNQSKLFPAEESSIDFFSSEPMVRVTIQIWDAESGELLYSKDKTLMMGISIAMNYTSTPFHMRDNWSSKLQASASNRASIIKQEIETTSRSMLDRTITICSDMHNEIDTTIDESKELFRKYQERQPRGAFISNHQKDGEINSFLKIRDYLELPSVKRVTIADPYFSVQAAAKLLTRIPRSDVRVEIITSLSKTNPDTREKGFDIDDYRKFLKNNASVLHNNLRIYNLWRGGQPVFHDRYLIRYYDNGQIDGFLLSNSLNSMGQSYPFVIAPLEMEVCQEVVDYLDSMYDPAVQSRLPKNERILCETLYDSTNQETPTGSASQKAQLPITWLNHWQDHNGKVTVPTGDLPDAVSAILAHWSSDKKMACRMLCALDAMISPWATCDLADTISKINGLKPKFIKEFIPIAQIAEEQQNYLQDGAESQMYTLWALLNHEAIPSRQGFYLLLERAGHVYYSENTWLLGGYYLLLFLNPPIFVDLMERLKSPLMFDLLATRMLFYPWSDQLYYAVLKEGSLCPKLLCAEWIFHEAKLTRLSNEKILKTLLVLAPETRVLQTVYLLSRIVFYIRTCVVAESLERWQALYADLVQLAAQDMPQCSEVVQVSAVYWAFDSSNVSRCKLLLDLADTVTELDSRYRLLDEAINVATEGLLDCSCNRNVPDLIQLYLKAVEIRFEKESEDYILGRVADWRVFRIATEPELKNYAYDKWRNAFIRAQRQMEVLRVYCERHPSANKANEWITEWEDRLARS